MPGVNGRAKRSEKGLLTPENCVVTLIDLQPQMLFGVANFDRQMIINNNVALSKAARVFDVPVILSTVETKSFSGNMWPQIQAVFPNQQPIERTTMNSWDDEKFVAAVRSQRQEEDRPGRPVDGDLRRPADDSGDSRRLRDLCRRGLLRRHQPACTRQRDEARDSGGCEARARRFR